MQKKDCIRYLDCELQFGENLDCSTCIFYANSGGGQSEKENNKGN